MENLKTFKIHSISQKAYILSMRYFSFRIFPAALVFPVTQFDISFFAFQVVDYRFRAYHFEIYNLTIPSPAALVFP